MAPSRSRSSVSGRRTTCPALVITAVLAACAREPGDIALVHPAGDLLREARAAAIRTAAAERGFTGCVSVAVPPDAERVELPDDAVAVVWDAGAIPVPGAATTLPVVRVAAAIAELAGARRTVDSGDEAAGETVAAHLVRDFADGGTVWCIAVDTAAPHAVARLRGINLGLADAADVRLGDVLAAPDPAAAERLVTTAFAGDAPPSAIVVVDPELAGAVAEALRAIGRDVPVIAFGPLDALRTRLGPDTPVKGVDLDLPAVAERVLDAFTIEGARPDHPPPRPRVVPLGGN